MRKAIRWEWWDYARPDWFTLVPIGDIHLGHVACDERLLAATIKRIADDPRCYWVGLGDYCEYINKADKRYDPEQVAPWVRSEPRGRMAQVQTERITELFKPIAHRCLGIVEGNHETAIRRKFEYDPYYEIVKAVHGAAQLPLDTRIGLGFEGWLELRWYRMPEPKRSATHRLRVYLHHGFVGGRLAGAKALNMQRVLWNHECDLCLMGHSHNTSSGREAREALDRSGRVVEHVGKGAFCGTFLGEPVSTESSPYYKEAGYFPTPRGTIEVELRPGAVEQMDRVRIVT